MVDNNKEISKFNINESFEKKIIANLIFEETFINRIINVIRPEYFSNNAFQYIIKTIKTHFKKYSKAPTMDSFTIYMLEDFDANDEVQKKELKSIFAVLLSIFDKENHKALLKDREHIQNTSTKFCWEQEMSNALIECSQMAKRNEFEGVLNRIELAFHSTDIRDEGVDYDDVEGRMDEDFRDNIMPFPWEPLNTRLGGGIGDREFMVAIGPMGAGKSLIAISIALHARRIGKTVVLFSLELDKKYVRHRTDVVLTKTKSEDLIDMKKDNPEKYKALLRKNMKDFHPDGKLRVVNIPAGSTVNTLAQELKLLKAEGFDPELFVVDYMDLMEPADTISRGKEDWGKFELITRECRDILARPMSIKGFGLMQGNTGSIKQKVITAENTSGGARRLHPADGVFGYARNNEDKQHGRANWSVIKNRFGPDGFALPVNTNYEIGQIEILDQEFYTSDLDERKDGINIKERLAKTANQFIEKRINPSLHDLDEIIEG